MTKFKIKPWNPLPHCPHIMTIPANQTRVLLHSPCTLTVTQLVKQRSSWHFKESNFCLETNKRNIPTIKGSYSPQKRLPSFFIFYIKSGFLIHQLRVYCSDHCTPRALPALYYQPPHPPHFLLTSPFANTFTLFGYVLSLCTSPCWSGHSPDSLPQWENNKVGSTNSKRWEAEMAEHC